MQPIKHLTFGRFRLDETNECLWQGADAIRLRPKAFAVLRHLVHHPGQLVTKQQLLEAVWPATFVGDAVLKDSIRQLREALGDDAAAPNYIETAHRRGYRFIGDLSGQAVEPAAAGEPLEVLPPAVRVLGREAELARMRGWLDRALHGERQTVFVSGEPGIGKTTLVNAVLGQAASVQGLRIARGQCLEHYGAGEAYLPVLDAFSRLCRAPDGERVIALLRHHAPAWLLQLPSLLPAVERESLQHQVPGATRERMLREAANLVEAMAADAPLVLLLEDLHWSDYSTLDLLAYLARRRDAARLMVIGTYRPVDVILGEHPLKSVKRELQAHGLCHELPLEYLTEEAVAQYVAARCPGSLPGRLARLVHRRTEGNPLFMVNLIEFLCCEGVLAERHGLWHLRGGLAEVESGVPENIRNLIEKQIDRLSDAERQVLEGASVVGMECSVAAIAAGLVADSGWVEERCEALVRRHEFLAPARLVELPDGTITPRYRFSHVLYLEVPYRLLPPMRRAQIHSRIGQRGESIYGDRVGEIAAELAMHFEQGMDRPRAVKYLIQAAENATHCSAHHEAAALASRGLQALEALPETHERTQQELRLHIVLGVSLMAIKGFASAEVEAVYRRALELAAEQGASRQAFVVQWLLGLFHYFRAEMRPAHEVATRLLAAADDLDDPVMVLEAHRAAGVTLIDLGRFDEAMAHLDTASALYDSSGVRSRPSFAGQDPKVVSDCFAARALWALGYPDRAMARASRALSHAQQLSHVETLVVANHFAAHLHQLRGEAPGAQERSETVVALAEEYGLELWVAFGHMTRGWAAVAQGRGDDGIAELRRGLAAYDATGARLWRAYYLGLLAQALARAGRVEEGIAEITEALSLVQESGEDCSAAELHRIHGELLIARAIDSNGLMTAAHDCFRRALTIARQQQARSWELRALTSLGRLRQRQGKRAEARRTVTDCYQRFEEGFETADLQAARALLDELSRNVHG